MDAKIASLGDWRGEMLAHIRQLIKQADPEVSEEVKVDEGGEPAGRPNLVARRHHLHRRDL
jgi:hypothetical protein